MASRHHLLKDFPILTQAISVEVGQGWGLLRPIIPPFGKYFILPKYLSCSLNHLASDRCHDTPVQYERDTQYVTSVLTMMNSRQNNGTEEIGLVIPPQYRVWRHSGSYSRIILWMRPANERRRYIVTSSLIGWTPTQHAYFFRVASRQGIWRSRMFDMYLCNSHPERPVLS